RRASRRSCSTRTWSPCSTSTRSAPTRSRAWPAATTSPWSASRGRSCAVSPHTVLVGYSGEVKLSDFGIAKTRAHSARGTKTGTVRGKIAYASPEQLSGLPVDHRTDQFALGVTWWEILAGRRLFDGRDDLETIGNVVRCTVPRMA